MRLIIIYHALILYKVKGVCDDKLPTGEKKFIV